jgi:hypothetical protein
MHISLLLEHPDLYQIDEKIVHDFINAFYELLWDRKTEVHKKLQLKILDGSHDESAFVEIRNEEMCIVEHMSPAMLSQFDEDQKYFVNHIDAVAIRRV